jgi:ABC-2 type transport system ATP-binding protein
VEASLSLPAIVIENVSKTYDDIQAVDQISLRVHAGQTLGLIGPNGAGKTTLLECLCGLQSCDSGEVLCDGSYLALSRRRGAMFYLPEGVVPYPGQTVRQVLRFFGGAYRCAADDGARLIDSLDLPPVLDRPVGQLSKGWRRRFLLAIALLAPQGVTLVDEPFDGLDLRQTREVMHVLRETASRGRAFVLSIHQLTEAERVCDRFVLLTEGRIVGEGTLPELRALAGIDEGSLEDVFLALS